MIDSPLYDAGKLDSVLSVMDGACAAILVLLVILCIAQRIRLAEAFGASGWFAVGLLLLPDVFLLILGIAPQYRYRRNLTVKDRAERCL